MTSSTGPARAGRGIAVGLLCAGVAVGAAELLAALVSPMASPILAVGAAAIDLTPEWLKAFAIREFGTANKAVLLVGIVITVAIVAPCLGVAAQRRSWVGYAGLAILASVGAAAVASRPGARAVDVVPTLVGAAIGVLTLRFLLAGPRRHHPPPNAAPRCCSLPTAARSCVPACSSDWVLLRPSRRGVRCRPGGSASLPPGPAFGSPRQTRPRRRYRRTPSSGSRVSIRSSRPTSASTASTRRCSHLGSRRRTGG